MKNNNRLNDIERKVLRLKRKGLTCFGIAVKLGVPEPIVYEICRKREEPCKWQLEKAPAVFLGFLFMFLLLGISFASATSVLLSDQGTDVKQSGAALSSGNLNVLIYSASSGGMPLFNQTFTGAIINGSWNVMINPDLEFGRSYWKDYAINGVNLNFSGQDRLEFSSPVGYINNASFINFSLIDSCPSGQAIRQVYSNGSVVCQSVSGNITDTDTVWNITGSNYLYNSSGVLSVNETKLNSTISNRASLLNVNSSIYSNSTTWWASVSGWISGWFVKNGNNLDLNETKLNASIDARASAFNETAKINAVNTSANIKGLGFYNTTETYTKTEVDSRITINSSSAPYLSVNSTTKTISLNETKLNQTIDARQTSTNLTNYALKNQSETFIGNITTTQTGFFGFLGSAVSRITKLFVTDIDVSNNVNVTGNVTASKFIGDGSLLTNLPAGALGTSINTTEIEDGQVQTIDIANGNITDAKIAGMNWTKLNSVPAGFADNVDNDTLYYAGGAYLYNNGSNWFYLNETKLNSSIDARQTSTNLTNYALKNQSETFAGNITTTQTGFFGYLGSLTSRVTKLFVQDIDASGTVNATNVIAKNNLTLNGTTIDDWSDVQGSGVSSGTGGWTNSSTETNTSLNVNIAGNLSIGLISTSNITTTRNWNAHDDFSDIAGTRKIHLRSDEITVAGALSSWTDVSGNSRNVTQATGANQPSVSLNALNGSAVAIFDGSSDFMTMGTPLFNSGPFTIIAVTNSTVATAYKTLMGDSAGTNGRLGFGMDNGKWGAYKPYVTTSGDTGLSVVANANAIVAWSSTGNSAGSVTFTTYLNGVNGTALTATSVGTDGTGFALGKFTGVSSGDYWSGMVAEVIVYNSSLSIADRQKVEGYLAYKYGLQGNLPAGHTYKTSAPTVNVTNTTSNSGSRVGIGTTSPATKLHVSDTTANASVFRIQDSSGYCDYNPESSAPTVSCTSDEKLKENIHEVDSSLSELEQYDIKEYTVKASGEETVGVIAQEVAANENLSKTVKESEDGTLMVELPNPWKIVKAIQELAGRLNRIEKMLGISDGNESLINNTLNTLPANENTEPVVNDSEEINEPSLDDIIFVPAPENESVGDNNSTEEDIDESNATDEENIIVPDTNENNSNKEDVVEENNNEETASGVSVESDENANVPRDTTYLEEVNIVEASDARLKKNIKNTDSALEKLIGLRIVDFTFISTGENKTGVIAQETQSIMPELVHKGNDGYFRVEQISSWKIVKAIQELFSWNEKQDKAINELKSENDMLKQELCIKDQSYSWCNK